jgi:hypothetical protein
MEETILRVKHEMSVSIDKTKAEIERAELYAVRCDLLFFVCLRMKREP